MKNRLQIGSYESLMCYSPTGNTNGVTGTIIHKSRVPASDWRRLISNLDGTIEQVYRYRDRLAVYYTKDNRLQLGLTNPDDTITHITQVLDLSVPVQWFTSAHGHLAHQDYDVIYVNVEYKVSTETRQELRAIRIKDGVMVGSVSVMEIGPNYVEKRQKFALSDPQDGIMVMVGGTDLANQATTTFVVHQLPFTETTFQRSSKSSLSEAFNPGCDLVVFKDRRFPDSPMFDVCIIGGSNDNATYRSSQLYCVRFDRDTPSGSQSLWYMDAWTCSSNKAVNGADRLGDTVYWIDVGMVGTLTEEGFGPHGVRFDQTWIKRYDLFRKATFSVKRYDKRIVESSLCVDEHGISTYACKVNDFIPHSPHNWTFIPSEGDVMQIDHPNRVGLTYPEGFVGAPRTIRTNDNEGSRVIERHGFEYDPQTDTMVLRYNQRAW